MKDNPLKLSSTDLRILLEISKGASTNEIAKTLHYKPSTIETYRSNMLKKANCRTMPQLTTLAAKLKLL